MQKCFKITDECTMVNRKAVEAIDQIIEYIYRNNQIMGKVTVLFCNDFPQTLHVVTKGTKTDEVNASLKQSFL